MMPFAVADVDARRDRLMRGAIKEDRRKFSVEVGSQDDRVSDIDDFGTKRIERVDVHPRRKCYLRWIIERAEDFNVFAIRIKVQDFAACRIGCRVYTARERAVVRCSRRLVVRVAAFKRVVAFQLGSQCRRHVQRHAAVKIGIRREGHAVQSRVDIGLGAVDHKAAAAACAFDKGQACCLGKVQHTIVHR